MNEILKRNLKNSCRPEVVFGEKFDNTSKSTRGLPIEAVKAGVTKTGMPSPASAPFTLKSGPVGTAADDTELAAFDLFFNDLFSQHILGKAAEKEKTLHSGMEPNDSALQRYVTYLLAVGLVPYAQERLPFRKETTYGLFKNDFLTSLFSHNELLTAKKLFQGERDSMTKVFNEISKQLWVPGQ